MRHFHGIHCHQRTMDLYQNKAVTESIQTTIALLKLFRNKRDVVVVVVVVVYPRVFMLLFELGLPFFQNERRFQIIAASRIRLNLALNRHKAAQYSNVNDSTCSSCVCRFTIQHESVQLAYGTLSQIVLSLSHFSFVSV